MKRVLFFVVVVLLVAAISAYSNNLGAENDSIPSFLNVGKSYNFWWAGTLHREVKVLEINSFSGWVKVEGLSNPEIIYWVNLSQLDAIEPK